MGGDYGYYHKKNRSRRGRVPLLLGIIDIVMLVLTVACSALLIAAYLARYINPISAWIFAFPGLIFPVLYISEIIFGLWWVVRWKKYALGVAVILLAGIGAAGAFYQSGLGRRYEENKPSRSEIVVMSYNVMGFDKRFARDGKGTQKLIAELVNTNNVDILCFQEFAGDFSKPVFNGLIPELKYYKIYPYELEQAEERYYSGLGIYSRYPIIASGLLPAMESERNYSMWADIRVQRDTVRVFNNHLNSTYIDNDDIDYLSSFNFVSERQQRARISEITGKLRESYVRRAPQAQMLAGWIAASPYPVVVCGDFNDTPASFAYNKISKGLTDSFVKKGHGAPGTYGRLFNMFRIDYILVSRGLEVVNYYRFNDLNSDHMPVAAGLEFSGR